MSDYTSADHRDYPSDAELDAAGITPELPSRHPWGPLEYQYIVTVHADNQNDADDMISDVLNGWAYVHPWERVEK